LSIEEHVQARTALLVSSNADLEAFSYTVSHDLQAPLRAIDGFAQVLCEDFNKQLPEQAYSLLARIRSNAQYMTQLINSLLDFSRLSRTALVLVDVDLNSLVENIQVQLNAKQHARFVLGDLPTVKADYILFSQVWMNLIDNALKFSSGKEDPCIEITAQRFSDQWHFVVRDNGAGFDMKYMDKLFTVFERLHHQKDFEGIGVGLAIVKRIVERHGGEIWAKGEVDHSAEVGFSLPSTCPHDLDLQ
jgi:light-regulated signal transduction histidine kinase (bacteriophytochrome)